MREPDHVVIVRYHDADTALERRVTYFARGEDQARCLALTIGSQIFAVSDVPPYVGSTRCYKVLATEWAPL